MQSDMIYGTVDLLQRVLGHCDYNPAVAGIPMRVSRLDGTGLAGCCCGEGNKTNSGPVNERAYLVSKHPQNCQKPTIDSPVLN